MRLPLFEEATSGAVGVGTGGVSALYLPIHPSLMEADNGMHA